MVGQKFGPFFLGGGGKNRVTLSWARLGLVRLSGLGWVESPGLGSASNGLSPLERTLLGWAGLRWVGLGLTGAV